MMMMNAQVGDLLSDVAATVAGGLGLVPSLALGSGPPLAEPMHGAAPDIAGRGTADPVAVVLSVVMLVQELGHAASTARIERAVAAHLRARAVSAPLTTADLGARVERKR